MQVWCTRASWQAGVPKRRRAEGSSAARRQRRWGDPGAQRCQHGAAMLVMRHLSRAGMVHTMLGQVREAGPLSDTDAIAGRGMLCVFGAKGGDE